MVGEVHPPKPSPYRNTKAEVGNVALMIGNWGERSETNKSSAENRAAHDRQVMGSPAQILVVFEATNAVAGMLEQPPHHVENRPQSRWTGPAPVGNVAVRDWYEHHVIIGKDAKQPVLMAARKNNCNGIECHCYEPWIDGTFRTNKKARSPPHKSWCVRSIGSKTSGIWATRLT